MLNPREDKSLWEKEELEDVGKVLIIEESYYDGLIEQHEDFVKYKEALERIANKEEAVEGDPEADRKANSMIDIARSVLGR